MNPFDLGIGDVQASTTATSGGQISTGAKVFNFGTGNPNTVGGFFSNPMVIAALIVGAVVLMRR